jgi:hypothetical protein
MGEYMLSWDFGSVNMSYNLINLKTKKIIKWDRFSIKDSTNEGSCLKLAKYLDSAKILDIPNYTETEKPTVIIVLEQQPRCNVKTICISGQLQMYYVLEKMITDTPINACTIKKIVGYHAKFKLKYYEKREGEEDIDVSNLKKGHYQNKQLSIKQCAVILKRDNTEWIDFFNENKAKRDDLSDTLLQNLAYMKFILKIQ